MAESIDSEGKVSIKFTRYSPINAFCPSTRPGLLPAGTLCSTQDACKGPEPVELSDGFRADADGLVIARDEG